MKFKIAKKLVVVSVVLVFLLLIFVYIWGFSLMQIFITGKVTTGYGDDEVSFVCGNNIKELGEVCDGVDLNGESCLTQGFDVGNLVCSVNCQSFDASNCVGLVNEDFPEVPIEDENFPEIPLRDSDNNEDYVEKVPNYYLIKLLVYGEEFEILDSSLEKGNPPNLENKDKEFKIRLFSEEDELLYYNSFSNPGFVFSDGLKEGGVIDLDEASFYLVIPNLDGAYKFKIYDGKGNTILDVYVDDLI